MFHHFADSDRHPRGQGAIDAHELRELLLNIGLHRLMPADEFLRGAIAGDLPEDAVALSFDDTLRCQLDVAVPVLRELGLRAFFFVNSAVLVGQPLKLELYRHFRTTAFADVESFYLRFDQTIEQADFAPEVRRALCGFTPKDHLREFPFYTDADRRFRFLRDDVLGPQRYECVMDQMLRDARLDPGAMAAQLWMNKNEIRSIHAEGHLIGLHSHTHPTRLAELPLEAQREEYGSNLQILRSVLGTAPLTAAHPCNSYSAATLEILRQLGVKLAFRSNMSVGPFGPLELPREDHANLLCTLQCAA